jgi:hypothetical protein
MLEVRYPTIDGPVSVYVDPGAVPARCHPFVHGGPRYPDGEPAMVAAVVCLLALVLAGKSVLAAARSAKGPS